MVLWESRARSRRIFLLTARRDAVTMFKKPAREALEIEIEGEGYVFASPRSFEFALGGRTNLPASKIAALSRLGDDELLREAEAIRSVEQRFAQALSGTLEDITNVGPLLRSMEPSIISQDNGWRSIMSALNACEQSCEPYKKIALVKYMQYLASRQEIVKHLYANRRQAKTAEAPRRNGISLYRPTPRFKETLIFDLNGAGGSHPVEIAFSRLPKGETVELALEPEQAVELLLAKHPCSIVLRDELLFIDEKGNGSSLHAGRNIIGRDADSDVVINAGLRDVSRKHLIIESDGASRVRLTDISSHGTSLPPRYLDHTSI